MEKSKNQWILKLSRWQWQDFTRHCGCLAWLVWLWDHSSITSAKMGGSENGNFCCFTVYSLFWCRWVGGPKKAQNMVMYYLNGPYVCSLNRFLLCLLCSLWVTILGFWSCMFYIWNTFFDKEKIFSLHFSIASKSNLEVLNYLKNHIDFLFCITYQKLLIDEKIKWKWTV